MSILQDVEIGPLRPERFEEVLSAETYARFGETIRTAGELLKGRRIWNVNSTARGGGVAEMLASLLAYARGAEVDARWVVIQGDPGFFTVTKRIHNNLHGAPGDGGDLSREQHEMYEQTLARNAGELAERMSPDDIVLLHDPQTAGLAEPLKETGVKVIWRCHVGLDTPNDVARRAWDFLRPYVEPADAYIFSRRAFAWERLEEWKIAVVPPSIDAFSPKNQELSQDAVASILSTTGLIKAPAGGEPRFVRVDGSPGMVERPTQMLGAPPPEPGVPLVVQVSRWDSLKDPLGVMAGFADHVAPHTDAHLVLAGPSVEAVADDPEGAEVLDAVVAEWERLPGHVQERVHLAAMPMEDAGENAAIVNALQTKADIVVQKSLAEGFGLTVAEGMWKARPVVASRIGGIQDQIEHGQNGMLIDDPKDLEAFGRVLVDLLRDTEGARTMGLKAKERVREYFLGPRHLMQYMELIESLIAG